MPSAQTVGERLLEDLQFAAEEARMRVLSRSLLIQVKCNAETFRLYEQIHREKGTPEGNAKADTNAEAAAANERLIRLVETGAP